MILLHRKQYSDGSERFAFFHTSSDFYGERSYSLDEVREEIARISSVDPDDWIARARTSGSNAETVADWYSEPTIAPCGGTDYLTPVRPVRLDEGSA